MSWQKQALGWFQLSEANEYKFHSGVDRGGYGGIWELTMSFYVCFRISIIHFYMVAHGNGLFG